MIRPDEIQDRLDEEHRTDGKEDADGIASITTTGGSKGADPVTGPVDGHPGLSPRPLIADIPEELADESVEGVEQGGDESAVEVTVATNSNEQSTFEMVRTAIEENPEAAALGLVAALYFLS